jgi:hypothetical protein
MRALKFPKTERLKKLWLSTETRAVPVAFKAGINPIGY